MGRWISEDPIGFGGGDANLYRYVGNESTGYVDPDAGHKTGTPNIERNPKLLHCLIRNQIACDAASIGQHIHRIDRDNITIIKDGAAANAIVTHWPFEEEC